MVAVVFTQKIKPPSSAELTGSYYTIIIFLFLLKIPVLFPWTDIYILSFYLAVKHCQPTFYFILTANIELPNSPLLLRSCSYLRPNSLWYTIRNLHKLPLLDSFFCSCEHLIKYICWHCRLHRVCWLLSMLLEESVTCDMYSPSTPS